MKSIEELAPFVLSHCELYREWGSDIFLGWLDWHNKQGFIQTVLNDDGTLAGLTITRPVMKVEDAAEHYAFDPEGSVMFVELVISTKRYALESCILAALQRFGMRDWIAWKRPPYYVTEFHDAHRFMRIALRRIPYGAR
jgi:hypothetical protein